MAKQDVAELAFARAWSVYMLMNKAVNEQDERRVTLERFIRTRYEAGASDSEELTVEGLTYLKRLDEDESDPYSFR